MRQNIFALMLSLFMFVGCDSKKSGGPPSHPVPSPQESDDPIETGRIAPEDVVGTDEDDSAVVDIDSGSLVGNGGNFESLVFTSTAMKSIYYIGKSGSLVLSCAESSGPCFDVADLDEMDGLLRRVKVYSAQYPLCETGSDCRIEDSKVTETNLVENKIFVQRQKWLELSQLEKVRIALLAYSSFFKGDHKRERIMKYIQSMVVEIHQQIFVVDFMVDRFREFLDEREIEITSIGNYSQEKFVERATLAMDCVLLAETKFPGRVDIKRLSLQNSFQYSPGDNTHFVNQARIGFPHTGYGDYDQSQKTLELGAEATLQQCFNVMALRGLNGADVNFFSAKNTDRQENGDIRAENLELWNLASNSIRYLMKNWRSIFPENCKNTDANGDTSTSCEETLLSESQIGALAESFGKAKLLFTDQTLCARGSEACESAVAINDPTEQKIVVNKGLWEGLSKRQKIKIIIHEFFGLAGIEEENYFYSAQLAPVIHFERENLSFYSSDVRRFFDSKGIGVRYAGGSLSQKQFRRQLNLAIDCFRLIDQRHPGRLKVKYLSLYSAEWLGQVPMTSYGTFCSAFGEEGNLGDWCNLALSEMASGTEYFSSIINKSVKLMPDTSSRVAVFAPEEGKLTLYFGGEANLQQCYNKVVSTGL